MLRLATIHYCFIRLTWLPRPTPPTSCVLTQRQFVKLKATSTIVTVSFSISLSCRVWHLSLTQVDFLRPLKSHKMVSNRIHISVCVSVCVLVSAVCSKPLSDGVVSQFTSSDSCIRAALKKEACSFASQSDMGLTPTDFETVCMLVTFGDYGFYFLHRSSWNESGRKKKKKKNGYMSYDNFEHSCNRGWPGDLE